MGASRDQEGSGGTPMLRGLNRRRRVGEVLSSFEVSSASPEPKHTAAQQALVDDSGRCGSGHEAGLP